MSGPVNNSPGNISQDIRALIIDKTGESGIDPKAIIAQAEQATAKFAKVAARQASEDANPPKSPGAAPHDPNAPELKKPVDGAIRQALKEGTQLQKSPQKTDSARGDNTQKQPVPQGSSQEMSTPRSQGQIMTKAPPGGESRDPGTLAGEAAGDGADVTDNNQLTKYVSTNTKAHPNDTTARNEKNPGQQSRALSQDPNAKSTMAAANAQSAANAAQGSGVGKSIVDDAKKLQDLNADMLAVTDGSVLADSPADGTGNDSSVSGKAAAMMFFNMVLQTVNENTINNMMSNMNALLASDDSASTDFQNQYDAISSLQAENDALGQKLQAEKGTLDDLKTASKAAADAAAAANPPDPALQQKADAAAAAVVAQQKVVGGLGKQFIENSKKITSENKQFYQELVAYNNTRYNMQTALLQQNYTKSLTNSALAELAMLEMMMLMDANALEAEKAMSDRKKLIQEAETAAAEKSMNEAIENKRKQDAMGCLAKLIFAIVTIVSFAAALFTGGASLVLAGIAMAVLVVDTAMQLAGKKTLTDMFMEKVMQPLMEKLAKALEGLGLSKDAAKGIAMALMAIVVIVVMVAAAGAAGALLGNVAAPLGKMAGETMVKNIANLAKVAVATGAVAGAGAQVGGAVYGAKTQNSIADANYANEMVRALFESMKNDKSLENLKDVIRDISEKMLAALESQGQAGKSILKAGIKS